MKERHIKRWMWVIFRNRGRGAYVNSFRTLKEAIRFRKKMADKKKYHIFPRLDVVSIESACKS